MWMLRMKRQKSKLWHSQFNIFYEFYLILRKTINSDVGSQHDVLNTTAMSISSSVATLTSAASAITTQASMTNNTQQQQQAKISLVPTNFLMQPQSSAMAAPNNLSQISPVSSQQIHLLQNSNASRILLSGAAGQVMQPSHATNAGIVTTGPGGMKGNSLSTDIRELIQNYFCFLFSFIGKC